MKEEEIRLTRASWAVLAHAFNRSTWETEAGGSLELEVSLVYIENFRTARLTVTA